MTAPTAPFTECPAVGNDTSCGILIVLTDTSIVVYSDPNQGTYDGADDTLIGVLNQSSYTSNALVLAGNSTLFGFDGDGLCDPPYLSCTWPHPTGYEGPNTAFSHISTDQRSGEVDFPSGLAAGASTYFSLEEALQSGSVIGQTLSAPQAGGAPNPRSGAQNCSTAKPINCATGDFWHTFTDLTIPGRGVAIDFERTYSSMLAGTDSAFGYGWSSPYSMALTFDSNGDATVHQENGSTIDFQWSNPGFIAAPNIQATLTQNSDGTYTLTDLRGGIKHDFTAAGVLTEIDDRNGEKTTVSHDSSGHLSGVTDSAGRTVTITTDSAGHITALSDPLGRTVGYSYDAAGNLHSVTDVRGGTWSFTYDSAHQMLTMTDPRGGTVTNTYDTQGRVTTQQDAMGRTTTLAYTGDPSTTAGSTTTITDPRGKVTQETYQHFLLQSMTRGVGTSDAATTAFTYDPITLQVASRTDANNHTTQYSYDSAGDLTNITDPLGRQTTNSYNSFGELTSTTDPSLHSTTYTYDAQGNLLATARALNSTTTQATRFQHANAAHPGDVTTLIDPTGYAWNYGYDSAGDRTTVTDPLGNVTTAAYDQIGRSTSMTDARGKTTLLEVDAAGELTKQTSPAGGVTTHTYDANGNMTATTDPDGNTTQTAYNADDQPTTITRADGTTVSYGYDLAGNRTSRTNGAGKTTTYAYDALNRQTSTTNPLGKVTTDTYDGAGNRTLETAATTITTTYGYDKDDELTSVQYSGYNPPNVTYSYNPDGTRATMTDPTGTTTYSYDNLGRVTSVTNGAGKTVSYSYDLDNRVLNQGYLAAGNVTRGYDAAGRMTSVADPYGHTTTYTYDPAGNITASTLPNGVTTATGYDANGNISSITDTGPGSAGSFASFNYIRDPSGQLTQETSTGMGQPSQVYTYNPLNQLASRNGSNYTYNAADDLTRLATGATATYNDADQVTTYTDAGGATTNASYSYNGERLSGPAPTAGTEQYYYNQAHHLSSVDAPNSNPSESTYHPLTITRIVNTTTGTGTCTPSPCARLGAGSSVTIQVGGKAGIPSSGVTAVALDITALNEAGTGYILVNAAGAPTPNGRSMSYTTNQAQTNTVISGVSSDGKITLYSYQATDFTVEVSGWYSTGQAASTFTPLNASRILDTRNGTGACTPSPCARLAGGATTTIQFAGKGGIPSNGSVTAVAYTLTAFNPGGTGYAITWPSGEARPAPRTLSFASGVNSSTLIVTKLPTNGSISLYSNVASDYAIDIAGVYMTASGDGSIFVPYDPASDGNQRVLDTRNGTGTCTPSPCPKIGTSTAVTVGIDGHAAIPHDAIAAVMNATAWTPDGDGGLEAWPDNSWSSNLGRNMSYQAGVTTSTSIQVEIGDNGNIDLKALTSPTNLTLDVEGWFEPAYPATSYTYNGDGLRETVTPDQTTGHTGATTYQQTWDINGPLPLLLADGTDQFIYGPNNTPLVPRVVNN
ncbi:hypothetical protein GCM10028801_00010 [Nocardioides maradonensis]